MGKQENQRLFLANHFAQSPLNYPEVNPVLLEHCCLFQQLH